MEVPRRRKKGRRKGEDEDKVEEGKEEEEAAAQSFMWKQFAGAANTQFEAVALNVTKLSGPS